MHFGNGTAEILRGDPRAFFASVHMIYGDGNDGHDDKHDAGSGKAGIKADEEGAYGFYPSLLGTTEVTDNYVSVGVFPPHPVQPSKPERNYFGRNNTATTAAVKSEHVSKYESVDVSEEKSKGESVNRSTDSVDGAELDESSRMDLSLDQPEECSSSPQPEECTSSPQPEECSSSPLPSRSNDTADEGVDRNKVRVKSESKSSTRAGVGARASGSPLGEFRGAAGFRQALLDVIIPQMEKFNPQLLIISGTYV